MKELLRNAKIHIWLNAILFIVWGILFIPSLLWWKESIIWVVFMSCYANFVGHFSALMGAFAEEKVDENGKQTNEETP